MTDSMMVQRVYFFSDLWSRFVEVLLNSTQGRMRVEMALIAQDRHLCQESSQ